MRQRTRSWNIQRQTLAAHKRRSVDWLKRLEAGRFKAPPDIRDDAIELTAEELNWVLNGFDL